MTVKKFREMLATLPDNAEIFIDGDNCYMSSSYFVEPAEQDEEGNIVYGIYGED